MASKVKIDLKKIRKKHERATRKSGWWKGLLEDYYTYIMPFREGAETKGNGNGPDLDRLFDATAPKAAFRFAGKLYEALDPEFWELAIGPIRALDLSEDDKQENNKQLKKVMNIVRAILQGGEYETSSHEMMTDLFGGTGAMYIPKGNMRYPIRFVSVPIGEIELENGPYGDRVGTFWKRKWPAGELKEMWPDGKYSEELEKKIKDSPDDEVEIVQYEHYLEVEEKVDGKIIKRQLWQLVVYCNEGKENDLPIWSEDARTSAWITPRFFKLPGSARGAGPGMLALPFIKTLNRARELALMAASFAVMPIWMLARNSGFNPDTAVQEPGAFWSVSRTGGTVGPTIQPLPIPNNFDISSVVIGEERDQVKEATFDDPTFSENSSVRSPTEIADRRATHNRDFNGVYGRLTMEIVRPVVQRVIDLLEQTGMLGTDIVIDQLIYQAVAGAPEQRAKAMLAQALVEWLSTIGQLAGNEAMMMTANIEKALPALGRLMGVDEEFIRSEGEIKQMQQQAAQLLAQQQAAEQQQAAPAPNGADAAAELGVPLT